ISGSSIALAMGSGEADAAGARVLETLAALGRDLAQDSEKYDFNEWRRWLGLALESAPPFSLE
ncbi:hypothetical protein, partial [Klebsiella aerogenes]|uniref:hypothetical protein n=1 Tax=Klebsiella aerogenes TaxID=548 RepID=UPI0019549682